MVRGLIAVALLLAAPLAAAQPFTIRFEADLREEIAAGRFDPQRDAVALRGARPPLAWDRGLPLAPQGEGRYALDVRFERWPAGGQGLQHKFRIERAGQGADAGWEPGSNHLAQPTQRLVQRRFGVPAEPAPTVLTGTIERFEVPSRFVAGPRPVWVWLPPGYAARPQERFPVLYLHDGQNVFDAAPAGAEWQVDEAAQRGVLAGTLRPFIVVAVASGRDRIAELTPTAMLLNGQRQGGGALQWARFLIEELKPLIDARYRTLPGREHTAVGGSSLGGLASLVIALQHPGTFGAALVVSPSLWWDDGWAERTVQALPPDTSPRPRLWLDTGALEGAPGLAALRRLEALLRARGWRLGADLAYLEDPNGTHDEASWAARVPAMLDFLHPQPEKPR